MVRCGPVEAPASGPRVLCEADGKPLTANALTYLLERASRKAGLATGRKPRHAGPHVLRHTFCSPLAMCGAPVRAIQELAGHRDLATTQRYMHLSAVAIENAIRLLEHGGPAAHFGDSVETELRENLTVCLMTLVVTLTFASWNQIAGWLGRLAALRTLREAA